MAHTPPGKTREKVFKYVKNRILEGRPPTVREVQDAFGFRAVQSARKHLEILVEQGRLSKEAGRSRGYRLPEDEDFRPTILVPLIGRVQAGALSIAIEEPEGYLPIQRGSTGGELFALRVRGDSMTGAGILEGDIAIVRRQPSADPGDIVVALVEDEATVKTLRFRAGRPELHAENPAYAPIVPDPDSLTLSGKVVEIRRYLEQPPLVEEIHEYAAIGSRKRTGPPSTSP